MKKLALLLVISGLFAAPPKGTVATVATDNYVVTTDIQTRIDALPAQYVQYYASPDGKKQLLDQIIEEKLLAVEAGARGYATNNEVLRTLDSIKEEVMVRQYVKDEVGKLTISDSEISAYYNANLEKFMQPEAVRASHILVDAEEAAKEILAQLNNGGDFAALAKEKSTDTGSAVNGGDLDFFTRGQMVKPFEDAAFGLKKNETGKTPVKTQFGWHIIRVTDKRAAKQQALAEVKQAIRGELLLEKQRAKVTSLISAAKTKYPVETHAENLKW
ncbi:MAG: peptidylprolyl isomerase [Candidatus Margulisbacteria bacterium]|jgi:peptidyl-prolyl cis-trans isomerase C|nr:peptidylprolyl isomerase [Candidatus Margulisiibacteriota bacterium]